MKPTIMSVPCENVECMLCNLPTASKARMPKTTNTCCAALLELYNASPCVEDWSSPLAYIWRRFCISSPTSVPENLLSAPQVKRGIRNGHNVKTLTYRDCRRCCWFCYGRTHHFIVVSRTRTSMINGVISLRD